MKFGIVGAGLRGRMYAKALRDVSDTQVIAFAEPSPVVASAASAEFEIPCVPDTQQLLDQFDPDALVIATPDFAHCEPVLVAAAAGKHLLIEKPLAMNLAEARSMCRAVNASGARCLIGFENRWNPHVLGSKRAIEAGQIGTPLTIHATLSNTWYVPTQMLSWSSKSSPLWFLMPHTVDMVLWFTGRRVRSVQAVRSYGQLAARGIDSEDVIHAMLTLDDDTTATLSSSWILPEGHSSIVDFHFQVIGTEGMISADPIRQGLDITIDSTRAMTPLSGSVGMAQVGAPIWMVQEFAASLARDEKVGPGIDHGLVVTEILCAIELAMREQRTVSISEVQQTPYAAK